MLRVLVCGSRTWREQQPIREALERLPEGSTVIHGAARGADEIAGIIAKQLGLEVLAFPADWEKHGKAAGPIRNTQMLREGRPHQVIAFTRDLSQSRGTANMVRQAKAAGVPVKVIGEANAD